MKYEAWDWLQPKIDEVITTWMESKEELWDWLRPKIDALIVTWEEEKGAVWQYVQKNILDNLVEWIVNVFETVLDRLFEKEGG